MRHFCNLWLAGLVFLVSLWLPGALGKRVVRARADSRDNKVALRGKPGQGYYAEMEVGTPSQRINVLVDTGSSNFAIACSPDPDIDRYFHIDNSSTYVNDGRIVKVPYTQGRWEGPIGRDLISLTSLPSLAPVQAYIACITKSDQFFINGSHWQGILGLSYPTIARPDSSVTPLFDTMVSEHRVPNMFSMQLCGTIDDIKHIDLSMGGSMIMGSIDHSLYKGDIYYTPVHREWYYEVIITDIAVGNHSLNMDCKEYNFDKTIVDSGTTNLRLPKAVFNQLVESAKSQTMLGEHTPPPEEFWSGDSVLCWDVGETPWAGFPSITIELLHTDNSTFRLVLSPQQYLRAVGDEYDPTEQEDCYKFAVAPSVTGTVLGAVVMEGFYVIFDRANKQLGFAQSTCNVRDSTSVISTVEGPFTTTANIRDCAYIKPEGNQSVMITVAYVLAGVCGACMIPLFIMLTQCIYQHVQRRRKSSAQDPSLIGGSTEEVE